MHIKGDIVFPTEWTIFTGPTPEKPPVSLQEEQADAVRRTGAALIHEDPALTQDVLTRIPDKLEVNGDTWQAKTAQSVKCQYDFRHLLGAPPHDKGVFQTPDYAAWGQVAYVFVPLASDREQDVTLGWGADCWLQVWINGEQVFDHIEGYLKQPARPDDYLVTVHLREGTNILVARYISGKGSSILALAGPRELRAGGFDSIMIDPLLSDDQSWLSPKLQTRAGDNDAVDIGDRRELFIDDFLVDDLKGGAERRLHHPQPQEVVLHLDKPWENPIKRYFSLIEHEGTFRFYYGGVPQATCLIESEDGIHWQRVELGMYEYEGSKQNNIVWRKGQSGHNFTPFKDTNPNAEPEQRYKAIGDHPDGGGLAIYASADSIHWGMIQEERVITVGGFDSQNTAFYDNLRGEYICYMRGGEITGPRRAVRGIRVARSKDYVNWSYPQQLDYTDVNPFHMYTNCIRPYHRAPHIYIGMPLRFVPRRRKWDEPEHEGLGDGVLMSSRDGEHFQRWTEAFILPGTEPNTWTDRMCEPAWGMIQHSSEELFLYWSERDADGFRCLRRGTLRTDGFVSIHAGSEVGECLTRPLIFSGNQLEINYRTSAIGLIRFALCDVAGKPLDGFDLVSSEVLFGNEVAHTARWCGQADLSALAGQPVRLRIRLQDADLYSFRFIEEAA